MKTGLLLLLIALSAAGCGRSGNAPAAASASPEEVRGALETAFKGANAGVKSTAAQVDAALKEKDTGKAFLELNQLSEEPALTPEQQRAVIVSKAALMKDLQERSEKGDAGASEVLKAYTARK